LTCMLDQIQGFFDIPVDHLYAAPVILDYLKKNNLVNNIIVVSPDAGGTERARTFAKKINAPLAIIDKRRDAPNVSKVMHVIGDVKDKDALIIDDMIDTGGTMIQAAQALKDNGAQRVFAALYSCSIVKVLQSIELIIQFWKKDSDLITIPVYDKKKDVPK